MHAIISNGKGVMIWKEIREGYAGGLGGRKGTEILYLYYNLNKKAKT